MSPSGTLALWMATQSALRRRPGAAGIPASNTEQTSAAAVLVDTRAPRRPLPRHDGARSIRACGHALVAPANRVVTPRREAQTRRRQEAVEIRHRGLPVRSLADPRTVVPAAPAVSAPTHRYLAVSEAGPWWGSMAVPVEPISSVIATQAGPCEGWQHVAAAPAGPGTHALRRGKRPSTKRETSSARSRNSASWHQQSWLPARGFNDAAPGVTAVAAPGWTRRSARRRPARVAATKLPGNAVSTAALAPSARATSPTTRLRADPPAPGSPAA
jgi:hypothetical protein